MRRFNFVLASAIALGSATVALAQYNWGPGITSGETLSDVPWGRVHFDPTNSRIIYAATTQVPDPFATAPLPPGNGLWKTVDGGANWTQIASGDLDPTYNILDFTICKANPNVLYCATLEGGVIKTTDGGTTWTAVNTGLGLPHAKNAAGAIVVDPTNPDKVYVSVGQLNGIDILSPSPDHPGFFYSHDGGASWTANNSGLPPRSDSFIDLLSNTSVPASLVIPENEPTTIYAGMLQAEANGKLLFGKKAIADALVYKNTNSGMGTWTNVSDGLRKIITDDSGFGSLLRFSVSGNVLTAVPAGPNSHALFLSNLGVGGEVDVAGNDTTLVKSQGIFALAPGSTTWIERNNGLPINNGPGYENAINTSPVAVMQSNPYTGIVGVFDSDGAMPGASKVWATLTAGDPWLKNWGDTGLDQSPTLGLPYCNPAFVEISADGRRAAASISWQNELGTGSYEDDGIYVVPDPN